MIFKDWFRSVFVAFSGGAGLLCVLTNVMADDLKIEESANKNLFEQTRQLGGYQVETVFETDRIKLVVSQGVESEGVEDSSKINLTDLRAVVSLRFPDQSKRYRVGLSLENGKYFVARYPVPQVKGGLVEARFQVADLSGEKKLLVFRQLGSIKIPAELQRELAIKRQRFCPLDGRILGLNERARRTKLNGKTVYVCSDDCVKELAGTPLDVISHYPSVSAHLTSEADTSLVDLQSTCPVMGMPLGSMGSPVKVMVGRHPLFLCCKGCLKKVEANPNHFVNESLRNGSPELLDHIAASSNQRTLADLVEEEKLPTGVLRVSEADATQIARQAYCPVMDEPLDAMGGPYKVNLNGRAVYICCPGCARSLERDPDTYIGQLAERGVNPPLMR